MSEHRRNYIKESIAFSQELMEDAHTVEVLPGEEIEIVKFVLDGMFAAQQRKGKITLPKPHERENTFPAAALIPGERVTLKHMTPAPVQIDVMRRFYSEQGVTDGLVDSTVDAAISRLGGERSVEIPDERPAAAFMYRTRLGYGETDSTARIGERPVVLIKYDPEKPRLQSVGALVTSSMYVARYIKKSAEQPDDDPNEMLKLVLEGYRVGAGVAEVASRRRLGERLPPGDVNRLRVEAIRKKHNDDTNPYRISPELIADLRRADGINPAILPPMELQPAISR